MSNTTVREKIYKELKGVLDKEILAIEYTETIIELFKEHIENRFVQPGDQLKVIIKELEDSPL